MSSKISSSIAFFPKKIKKKKKFSQSEKLSLT